MHFWRRKVATEFVQLFRKFLAFAFAESPGRSPVALLDPHTINVQSRDEQGEYAGGESIDLIHVINGTEGKA